MICYLFFLSLLTLARFEGNILSFQEYSAQYLPSTITEEERLQYHAVWKKNVDYIIEHNTKTSDSSFKLGINEFTHLLPHQLPKSRPKPSFKESSAEIPIDFSNIPTEVDWRVKGDVTAVHNQGEMGCVFEFAFADAVSSFYAISTNQRIMQFNPKQLIDCCTEGCSCNQLYEPGQLAGCIKKHGGMCPDYPDTENPECECLKCNGPLFMFKGMREVPSKNETALQYVVAKEPVMVGIDAAHKGFQLYKEGIYSSEDCSSERLDHDLLVVGYGTDDGKDYWLCKNSWGTSWGMNGYVKIARNAHNMCGIATAAYYPY